MSRARLRASSLAPHGNAGNVRNSFLIAVVLLVTVTLSLCFARPPDYVKYIGWMKAFDLHCEITSDHLCEIPPGNELFAKVYNRPNGKVIGVVQTGTGSLVPANSTTLYQFWSDSEAEWIQIAIGTNADPAIHCHVVHERLRGYSVPLIKLSCVD
jgi:hypothetical protein